MRLNRGTIALVVVGLIVIVGVLLINNRQENAPDATPSATPQSGGPLFTDLSVDSLAQVVVRDNTNGARTVLVRTSDGLWELDEPNASSSEAEALQALVATLQAEAEATEEADATPEATASPEPTPDPELNQDTVLTTINGIIGLNASDSFDSDQLEGFALDQPAYSILATATDGTVYVLHIGGENPSGNRYYVVQEQLSIDEMTPEPSATAEETEVAATDEVIEGEAVATVIVEAGESLGAPGENILGGGASSVEDATEETPGVDVVENLTEAAELSEEIEATNAAVAGVTEAAPESTEAATPEATVEMTEEATLEATPEATVGPLPTPTPEPLAQPLVTLVGTQTINTVPKTIIDQLIGFIALPPYFVPTPTPTLPFEIPEITIEATPEVTEEAAVEATEEATTEPTIPPTTRPTRTATTEPTASPTTRPTRTPQPTATPSEEPTEES